MSAEIIPFGEADGLKTFGWTEVITKSKKKKSYRDFLKIQKTFVSEIKDCLQTINPVEFN
jgi:hypothetical protein